ncbi:MAG: 30S ribosomal protein S5 [Spirochaetales bacterium]|nr:30S ribosomal protein S5 [Leptospiraceae bacterium]MCP5480121.1 30S ribosomal protein S5 [Spirochaetales bacterium]MCP5485539.1 30S ribosomal protein S5 [Spirochaetales bacterium]
MLQPGTEQEREFVEKVVRINRVSKVVKGGRRFSFNALAVVGDQRGTVGLGLGKANEVPDAIRKAIETARRTMLQVNLTHKGTLPHEVRGRYKSTRVMLRPATPGTGIIAGEAVRSVVEQAGIRDVLTKVVGSKNTINVVQATIEALRHLETPIQSARKRAISLPQLFGHTFD